MNYAFRVLFVNLLFIKLLRNRLLYNCDLKIIFVFIIL